MIFKALMDKVDLLMDFIEELISYMDTRTNLHLIFIT